MAYYVSVVDGPKRVLAAGPFNRHGDALRMVGPVRAYANRTFGDVTFAGFGTCRVRSGRMPVGKLNGAVGLPTEGRIAKLPAGIPTGRWALDT